MLSKVANHHRATGRAGVSGLLAGLCLAACTGGVSAGDMVPELRDDTAVTSRQIAVTVAPGGKLAWEGRLVSFDQLEGLMRDAALGSTPLVLLVIPATDEVRYGDAADVITLASRLGLEARLAEPKKNGAGQ